jgi:hypothetical protein
MTEFCHEIRHSDSPAHTALFVMVGVTVAVFWVRVK